SRKGVLERRNNRRGQVVRYFRPVIETPACLLESVEIWITDTKQFTAENGHERDWVIGLEHRSQTPRQQRCLTQPAQSTAPRHLMGDSQFLELVGEQCQVLLDPRDDHEVSGRGPRRHALFDLFWTPCDCQSGIQPVAYCAGYKVGFKLD